MLCHCRGFLVHSVDRLWQFCQHLVFLSSSYFTEETKGSHVYNFNRARGFSGSSAALPAVTASVNCLWHAPVTWPHAAFSVTLNTEIWKLLDVSVTVLLLMLLFYVFHTAIRNSWVLNCGLRVSNQKNHGSEVVCNTTSNFADFPKQPEPFIFHYNHPHWLTIYHPQPWPG